MSGHSRKPISDPQKATVFGSCSDATYNSEVIHCTRTAGCSNPASSQWGHESGQKKRHLVWIHTKVKNELVEVQQRGTFLVKVALTRENSEQR